MSCSSPSGQGMPTVNSSSFWSPCGRCVAMARTYSTGMCWGLEVLGVVVVRLLELGDGLVDLFGRALDALVDLARVVEHLRRAGLVALGEGLAELVAAPTAVLRGGLSLDLVHRGLEACRDVLQSRVLGACLVRVDPGLVSHCGYLPA